MLCLLKSYRLAYKFLFIISLLCGPAVAFGQINSLQNIILKLQSTSDSTIRNSPPEKLYIQFDKPYYALGDTIWFKGYLFNAPSLLLSAKSGLLHIDITSDSGKMIKEYLIPVSNGVSWGNITLNDKEFKPGTYTLRAYTNWMCNFGQDYFFYKQFYISGADENSWLITSRVSTTTTNVNFKLKFSDIDQVAFSDKLLQIQVKSGTKNLYNQKMQTDPNGLLDVNFTMPRKSTGLAIIAESVEKDKKAVIPINLSRAENADVQFLPEGGNLIAGLTARIGFKAIGEDGRGIDVFGIITDHEQQQAASFQSLHNGMGSFSMDIKAGESYIAKVTLPDGTKKEYPLPAVKVSGTVLRVKNVIESDSVAVTVAATDDLMRANNSYFLIGKARGIVCYAAILSFHDGQSIRREIAKSLFPSGVTHFILMTAKEQALNERMVYIDHHDNLHIRVDSDEPEYNPRDSIGLHIKVTDNNGNPVAGNFSLAVTDDQTIKTDTLNNENIITRILLTSDLKGYVEQPGYYLQKQNRETAQALDNLLLTQGWVGYEPQAALPYEAETEYTVKGKVINVFSKPVKHTKVLLFSKSPMLIMDTLTNKQGQFSFNQFPKVDTPLFILKAVNRNGKSFNVGINMDEVSPPVFNTPKFPQMQPWYVNSDTTLINSIKQTIANKKLSEYTPDGKHRLKTVTILAKKTIKNSLNLNGPGNADQVFDEKEMEQAGKETLLDLFSEKIKGFREGAKTFLVHSRAPGNLSRDIPKDSTITWYFVADRPVVIFIDGVDLSAVINIPTFFELRRYLMAHNAEDIKGIEVNETTKYATIYRRIYQDKYDPQPTSFQYCFIEVTTRSGHGPGIDNTPGVYLYKPVALSCPGQFYKPRYNVNDKTTNNTISRSIIDWEPNITTDKNGEGRVTFYASNKASTYTLIMEGSDANGSVGFKTQKIIVTGRKETTKSK
ncbi:MAG: hypothetical protein JWP37_3001 [Mucilaginibacter sp.]|nr:hypothetical protein [Mucilaginibacter sp.]